MAGFARPSSKSRFSASVVLGGRAELNREQTVQEMGTTTIPGIHRVCDESARGVYFIAGTMALMGLLSLGYALVVDAALLAGLGFWLQRARSRVPAGLILLLGVMNCGLAFMNFAGINSGVRASPVAAGIFVWLGARALVAIKRASAAPPGEQGIDAAQEANEADKRRAG